MQKFSLDGFSDASLTLALFKNVKNATELKKKYLDRVALLDAGMKEGIIVLPYSTLK